MVEEAGLSGSSRLLVRIRDTYACLNMENGQIPQEIQGRSILIAGDSHQVIQELLP